MFIQNLDFTFILDYADFKELCTEVLFYFRILIRFIKVYKSLYNYFYTKRLQQLSSTKLQKRI